MVQLIYLILALFFKEKEYITVNAIKNSDKNLRNCVCNISCGIYRYYAGEALKSLIIKEL